MDLHGLASTLQIAGIWGPLRSAASPKALVYVIWCFGTLLCRSRLQFDRSARTEFLTSAAMSANARRSPPCDRARLCVDSAALNRPTRPQHIRCMQAARVRPRSRPPRGVVGFRGERRRHRRLAACPHTVGEEGSAVTEGGTQESDDLAARARTAEQAMGRAGRQMARQQAHISL